MTLRLLHALCAVAACRAVEDRSARAEAAVLDAADATAGGSVATRDVLWSSLQSAKTCEGHCEVPAGEVWILDTNMTVETLTIRGTLKWETEVDNLVLTAGYVLVADQGYLQVGTRVRPMLNRATIYITERVHTHADMGWRFLGSLGEARIEIHGRALERTWTLLAQTAKAGSGELRLKHDPEWMGWRVGDRIGVATTSRGESTKHTVTGIGPATEWQLGVASVVAGVERPEWNNEAANAIDGQVGTSWGSWCAPSCTGQDQWLALNLEGNCRVSRVKVRFNSYRYAPKYELQVWRANGTGWETAASVVDGAGGWREVPIDREAVALRLFADYDAMKENRHDYWAGLWLNEIEVYGVELWNPLPKVLHVDPPLSDDHWGGFREIGGYRFEMAAEVVNLERSVLITGNHSDFEETQQGLHTIMAGNGIMDVRYARVEYCGQRDFMGRYCLHFHRGGHCPDCAFQGNAIVESQQVGVTVHGTHRSLVDNNVLWDTRGTGIYVEDGNEMFNTISNNVVICSLTSKCAVTWQGRIGASAGIYMIGMTNDIIGNHVAGHENGLWSPGGVHALGQGWALHKVCPANSPYGTIKGNVFHDCNRFGIYLDNQFPRNLERDVNGFVTDMGSCGRWTTDGADNGLSPANMVEDQFDWHNLFVGQYSLGDVSYVRLMSVNNAHSLYWKASKNFADGKSVHIRDSIFANDPKDAFGSLQLLGPSGPFAFLVRNTTFVGGPVGQAALAAGQHCGLTGAGGPCNVQYLLQDVDFQISDNTKRIKFGAHCDNPGYVQPMFLARDGSLGGHRNIVSRHLNGFANVSGCEQTGVEWDYGYSCNASVRRLNVWSKDVGDLMLTGPGYDVEPNENAPVLGMNAGRLPFEPMHRGYGAVVLKGRSYSINGSWLGDTTIDFSDKVLEEFFGEPEGLFLNISGEICELSSSADRSWLHPLGVASGINVRSQCMIVPSAAPEEETFTTTPEVTPITTTPAQCALEEDVPCCPDGSCEGHCSGTAQCCPGADGKTHTCPSANASTTPHCTHGKAFDCTNITGVGPPGRLVGQCEFAKEPAGSYYWEPWCQEGSSGCLADDVNWECRFCDVPGWNVTCPPATTTKPGTGTTTTTLPTTSVTTTTSTSTSAEPTTPPPNCTGLPDVAMNCSSTGCKVLARGMTGRTCESYCTESGYACVGAWEDMDDDCNVMATLTCEETYAGTPDLICECAPITGPTTAPATTATTTTVNFAWVFHLGVHCFDGHGAAGIPGKDPMPAPLTLGECFEACKAEAACEGVAVQRNLNPGAPGACWQRTNLTLSGCQEGTDYHFWERVAIAAPETSTSRSAFAEGTTGTSSTSTSTTAAQSSPASTTSAPQATTTASSSAGTSTARPAATTSTSSTGSATTTSTSSTRPSAQATPAPASTTSAAPSQPRTQPPTTSEPAASTTTSATTTASTAPPVPGAAGQIRSLHGLCLQVADPTALGAEVRVGDCSEGSQEWTYDPDTGLIAHAQGYCLDAPGRATQHAKVQIWTCDSANEKELWTYDEDTRQIRNHHGLCLDSQARTSAGGAVYMWPCDPRSPNQKWYVGGSGTTATSTPRSMMWAYHPQRNCYEGHGAIPVPGKGSLAGEYTLESCKAACEAEPLCEGIVVPRLEDGDHHYGSDHETLRLPPRPQAHDRYYYYPSYDMDQHDNDDDEDDSTCRMRMGIKVIECQPLTDFDLWHRVPDAWRYTTATTTTTDSWESSDMREETVWESHEGLHCWPFRGAEALPGSPVLRNVTVQECQDECEAVAACRAISVKRREGSELAEECRLRRAVDPSRCHAEHHYETHQRRTVRVPAATTMRAELPATTATTTTKAKPPATTATTTTKAKPPATTAQAATTTQAKPPATTATTTAAPGGEQRAVWVRHVHRNCWSGRGASLVPGRPTMPGLTLQQCQAACEAEGGCEAVVVPHAEGAEGMLGNCRLRKDLVVSACMRDMAFDLWEYVRVGEATMTWVRHEGKSCGNGKGAEGVPGKSTLPARYSLEDCRVQCEAEPRCEGIMFLRDAEMAKCRLRMDLDIPGCESNSRYDLWERVLAPALVQQPPAPSTRRRRRRSVQPHLFHIPA